MALGVGENIETVKDALGHSTSYTTLTTYGHATKRASSAAVHCIDERLAGLGPTSGPLLENAKEKAL
ncbi:MAG: hypothetical protein ABR584_07295 [Candidatus Baltobacteraceae bacterium]